MDAQEEVWGGSQPQPWRDDIILTPQSTSDPEPQNMSQLVWV